MSYVFPDYVATARYSISRPQPADADGIFNGFATDPQVTGYLTWSPARSVDETRMVLAGTIADWTSGTRFAAIIRPLADPQRIVGKIESRPGAGMVGYGYVLARSEWGQGCMSEVLSHAVGHALSHPGIFRAEALCDHENLASARVMQKAGMQFEGRLGRRLISPALSPDPRDCLLYARVR